MHDILYCVIYYCYLHNISNLPILQSGTVRSFYQIHSINSNTKEHDSNRVTLIKRSHHCLMTNDASWRTIVEYVVKRFY